MSDTRIHPDTQKKHRDLEETHTAREREKSLARWLQTHSAMDPEYDKMQRQYNLLVSRQQLIKKRTVKNKYDEE